METSVDQDKKILAIDVHYKESCAKTVGVLFDWDSEYPIDIKIVYVSEVADYVPGQFYKRELPCILRLLSDIDIETLAAIVVDGHVYINNERDLGLGGHLFEALKGRVPIVRVAKRSFYNTDQVSLPLARGDSKNPLFVSAIGMDETLAMEKIRDMKGKYRIPDILKLLDQKTKED